MHTNKLTAIKNHLGVDGSEKWDNVSITMADDENTFTVNEEEYLVLTDYEANEMFTEQMEQYIDDCVLSEIPENLRFYFDSEMFVRDVELSDGRGGTLAPYDGVENEETVDGVDYFIYRIN